MNGGRESLLPLLPEKLTPEQANELRDVLTKHYRCRVATVTEYCEALREWARVMVESGYAPEVGEMAGKVMFLLYKSNLAARLVYMGEPVRTEKCPKHDGRWSGCHWHDDPEDICECETGNNTTGWLPNEGCLSDREFAAATAVGAFFRG